MNDYKNKSTPTNYPSVETSTINLVTPSAELFDSTAKNCADIISKTAKGLNARKKASDVNKSTQLRKFYDEIVMWDERIKQNPNTFTEQLPLIRMINAKVAYAQGRELVDENFSALVSHCLKQLDPNNPKTMHNFRLFMEAFMGFYKMYKPSNTFK